MISATSSSPSPTAMASMKGDTGSGFEEAQNVDVVSLVGDGEPDQVEVAERAQRLERKRLGAGTRVLVGILGVGEEDALADGLGQGVQVLVDRLEAQVGHAHRVGIGIDQRNRNAAAPILADDALFRGDETLGFPLQFPRHGVSLPRPIGGAAHGWECPASSAGLAGAIRFSGGGLEGARTAPSKLNSHDLDVYAARPRPVELGEEDRLEAAQRQLPSADADGDAPAQQRGAEVRMRVAA